MASSNNTIDSFIAWVTPIAVNTSSTLLLETNRARVRYVVQNTDGIVYLKLGYDCSPMSFTYRLTPNMVLEDFFQGPITACTAGQTGICLVTEEV